MKQFKHKRNFQLNIGKLRKVSKNFCVGNSTKIPVENLKNAVTLEEINQIQCTMAQKSQNLCRW